MAFDQSLIGKEFEATQPVAVTAEEIEAFCRALGEDSPLYGRPGPDGAVIAPPSFAVTFRNTDAFFQYTPRFGRGFDAGKEVEFIAQIGRRR